MQRKRAEKPVFHKIEIEIEKWPVTFSIAVEMLNGVITFDFPLPKLSLPTKEIWYAVVAAAPVAVLMITSIAYSVSSKKKKKKKEQKTAREIVDVAVFYKRPTDVFFEEVVNYEMTLEADAKYAEELQVQEALLASQNSTHRASSPGSLWMQVVCNICFEDHATWQMFRNSTCSHSFCYDCTIKHATTKIQAKHTTIACPGVNCNSTLDFNTLRLIIPRETLVKWDELLCESMIPESHKIYCPFADCSVLLINDDSSNGVTKVDCPVCRRSFCKVCRVPWHSKLSCKEFRKQKGKSGDELAVALAKKKKWRKCPNCKFFVEKTEGCLQITCRCKYRFCYGCGAKWSSGHYGCKRIQVTDASLGEVIRRRVIRVIGTYLGLMRD